LIKFVTRIIILNVCVINEKKEQMFPKKKKSQMRKGAKMQDDLIEKVEILKDLFDIINDSVLEESQPPEIE